MSSAKGIHILIFSKLSIFISN